MVAKSGEAGHGEDFKSPSGSIIRFWTNINHEGANESKMDDIDPDAGGVSFVFDNKFIEVIEEDDDAETHETMEDPRDDLATNESDVEKKGDNTENM